MYVKVWWDTVIWENMLFLTVILMMTTIVDSGRILQASIDIRQTNQSVTNEQEITLLEKYPGHFLTTEEQRELASITYHSISFSDKLSVDECTDLVQNGKTSLCTSTIISSVAVPHACCKSYV
ncbi:hypothetical protein KP79_PYT24626 [Mizuhopecten yessoensis]|uniref:Uncharacterized protein n=1 Tax=Mizuhopecten yessoensis TaxID=6573 RepID=A0A210Q588_MIZYE|nr:hypothetical protein KP79_PYT24626 [Mizuhopecten yessoensis]